MDRDRQMSETLGHDTELGDSARLIMISLPGLPYHANDRNVLVAVECS